MRSVDGFVLFAADRPLVGLDPHPAFAPNPPAELTAKGWADAYSVFDTRTAAEAEAEEDLGIEMERAEHADDCVDPDFPLAVRVFENGDMEVFADAARTERLAYYTNADLFGAFAMETPILEAARLGVFSSLRSFPTPTKACILISWTPTIIPA